MAKLLTREEFANLRTGDHVWIEWMFGTGAIEWEVHEFSCPQSNVRKLAKRTDYNGINYCDQYDYDRDKEWRYWDAKPTLEEREDTPWTC